MSTCETNLLDFWQRYALRVMEEPQRATARARHHRQPRPQPQPQPRVAESLLLRKLGLTFDIVRKYVRSVQAALSDEELTLLAGRVQYHTHCAVTGAHRPMKGRARVYQTATCCGRHYVRWRFADGEFRITDQTCLTCAQPLSWVDSAETT